LPVPDHRTFNRRSSKHVAGGGVEHGSSPDSETAMLISLLLAGGVLHKVQPSTDRNAQTLRVQHLVQDNWVAAATRKALRDNGAVAAGLADLPGFLGS